MAERKAPRTDADLWRALQTLFGELPPETPDEVEATLHAVGLDPDEVGARMAAVAEEALAKSPFNWRQRAKPQMEAARAQLGTFRPELPSDRSGLIAAIVEAAKALGPAAEPMAAHRNLERQTDEDLRDLLRKLQYLAQQRTKDSGSS